jgi:hypothetical protein
MVWFAVHRVGRRDLVTLVAGVKVEGEGCNFPGNDFLMYMTTLSLFFTHYSELIYKRHC